MFDRDFGYLLPSSVLSCSLSTIPSQVKSSQCLILSLWISIAQTERQRLYIVVALESHKRAQCTLSCGEDSFLEMQQ